VTEIFVFGSNLAGKHGKGAAKFAHSNYGAEYGVSEGRTGNSYAVPTKDEHLQPLHILYVAASIERFLDYARGCPKLRFRVTRIGCGLAGFTSEQIAPLFENAPTNCTFDPEWDRFGLPVWEDVI
jgi:hypothetical protein